MQWVFLKQKHRETSTHSCHCKGIRKYVNIDQCGVEAKYSFMAMDVTFDLNALI